jgi:hypothetical protein
MKPTVTQLIDLLNKPNLIKWANKIGLDGISLDAYRAEKMKSGTSMHRQIEDKVRFGKEIEDLTLRHAYIDFTKNFTVLECEKSIETDYFKGRLDLIVRRNGKEYVCDLKSSSGLYFENKLQLAAYKMAHPKNEIAIIHLPNLTFEPVNIDFAKYCDFLILLSKLYMLKNELK